MAAANCMRDRIRSFVEFFGRNFEFVRSRPAERITVVLLLITHAGMLGYSATTHSPTQLEPAFLAAGISHWEFGRFELYRVNPPLVRMIAALPSLAAGYKADWSRYAPSSDRRCEFSVGADFAAANGVRSLWLITLARWACIPFSLVGALVCYNWSRDVWGSGRAGLTSLTVWCFEPTILAHSELITADAASASLGLLAGYTFHRWVTSPDWQSTFVAGAGLGLAVSSKMTWLILFGVWPVIWLVVRLSEARSRLSCKPIQSKNEPNTDRHPATQERHSVPLSTFKMSALLILGLLVLHMQYGFLGTFTSVSCSRLRSKLFMSAVSDVGVTSSASGHYGLLELLLQILPPDMAIGLDQQQADFESRAEPSFICNTWSDEGHWVYYLYALSIKLSLGLLLLCSVSLLSSRPKLSVAAWLTLLLPAMVIFFAASQRTEVNEHYRYILPVVATLTVYVGKAATTHVLATKLPRLVVRGALVCILAEQLLCFPNSLTFFNLFAGGPVGGKHHLRGSSCDWGQDSLSIAGYFARHQELRPLFLSTKHRLAAEACGLSQVQFFEIHRETGSIFPAPPRNSYILLTVEDISSVGADAIGRAKYQGQLERAIAAGRRITTNSWLLKPHDALPGQ